MIMLSLAALLLVAYPASAQAEQRCFAETGQCISGRFLEYWEQNGGLAIFGFPVTAAAQAANNNTGQMNLVQWFERSRFELRPEQPTPHDVVLGRLGDDRLMQLGHHWQSFVKQTASDPHYFPQTGHAIDYEPFWTFWSTHGIELDGQPGTSTAESIALFGLPISRAVPTTNFNGDLVLAQWFERARLEYHPSNPDPYKVLLGLLGSAVRLNQRESSAELPEPVASGVQVIRRGFGQDGQRVGYGFVLHNNQSRVAERVEYDVKLVDASGAGVGTDAHFIRILYPNQTVGVADEIVVDAGTQVTGVQVQVSGGRLGSGVFADFESNPLTAEQAADSSDQARAKVSGTVRNRLPIGISDVRVDALAYDSSGAIIGGGFVYLDFVPANAAAPVDVLITRAGKPARVELYPIVTIDSEVGEADQDDE
jgi:hypothetical protein